MAITATGRARIPPYSIHSEKIVIGSLLQQPDLIHGVREHVPDGTAFFRPEYGRLYEAILAEAGGRRRLDSDALIRRLVEQQVFDRSGDDGPLRDLAETAEPAGAVEHARNLAEKARMRLLIDALSDMLHDAYHSQDGFKAILGRARRRLTEVGRRAKAGG